MILYVASLLAPEQWPAGGLPPWAWASIAFQSVIVAFASYLAWFWLLGHYPATRLASFTLLTPLFGLALGALLLKEPITLRLGIAVIGVCAGIYRVNRPVRRPPR